MSPVKRFGVEADHVLCKRVGLREEFAVGPEGKAGAVKYEAVVAANLVHHGDGNAVVAAMAESISWRSCRLPSVKGEAEMFRGSCRRR